MDRVTGLGLLAVVFTVFAVLGAATSYSTAQDAVDAVCDAARFDRDCGMSTAQKTSVLLNGAGGWAAAAVAAAVGALLFAASDAQRAAPQRAPMSGPSDGGPAY